jgi:urease accessory protein
LAVGLAVDEQRKTFAANRAVGRITLTVENDGRRSRRTGLYEDGPLRARFPHGPSLEAVAVNTAGGVAGGDRFSFDISVGAGADLTLTTAAAEKVYRALDDDATIEVKLQLGAGATLAWLPQETILFDGARLRRRIEMDAAADARLVLAEALVFGRTAMGEIVSRGRLVDRWRVRRAGELVFADAVLLDGAIGAQLGHAAVAAGACAIGTVMAMPADAATADRVRALDFRGEVGVSAWNGFALARMVARNGADLRHDLALVLPALGSRLPRLWLS